MDRSRRRRPRGALVSGRITSITFLGRLSRRQKRKIRTPRYRRVTIIQHRNARKKTHAPAAAGRRSHLLVLDWRAIAVWFLTADGNHNYRARATHLREPLRNGSRRDPRPTYYALHALWWNRRRRRYSLWNPTKHRSSGIRNAQDVRRKTNAFAFFSPNPPVARSSASTPACTTER